MSGSDVSGDAELETESPVLTVAGTLTIWAGTLLLVAGFWRYDGALIWLGGWLWLAVAVARWWAPRNLRGLRVRRRRPARVFAGEVFSVTLTVEIAGAGGWWRFRRAGRGTVVTDGMLGKNTEGMWLANGVGAGEQASATLSAKLHRRGREDRRNFEARSSFPLGLFEVKTRGLLVDETFAMDGGLIVYPRPYLPEKVRRDLAMFRFDLGGLHGIESEPGEELRGIREYRSGDPVKAVHWPATARAGRPMVREWEPPAPRPARYGLLLHTWESGGRLLRPDRWELALRLAAGVVAHCREAGISLSMLEEIGSAAGEKSLEMPERVAFSAGFTRLALARRGRPRDPACLRLALEKLEHGCDRIFVISDVPLEYWREVVEENAGRKSVLCLDSERVAPIRQRKIRRAH